MHISSLPDISLIIAADILRHAAMRLMRCARDAAADARCAPAPFFDYAGARVACFDTFVTMMMLRAMLPFSPRYLRCCLP
jgi:hypothetical protein